MKNKGVVSGGLNNGKENIKFRLSFLSFEEDGSKIVYCPALEVYGYGTTKDEAENSFMISLEEFITYTFHKGTFYEELKRIGWNIPKSHVKKMEAPPMTQLLSSNENFSRIFNNSSFKKYDKEVLLPVA